VTIDSERDRRACLVVCTPGMNVVTRG
jgi:hypothetical protein